MFKRNRIARILLATNLLATIFLATLSIPANAESAYRYWGYFQATSGATTWTAAMTGPSVEVKEGDVEGWVFMASGGDLPSVTPMMDPDFLALCGDEPEVNGKVRVGLVVDFGAGEIAPSGDTPKEFYSGCVSVPVGSVGLDVLQAALDVRSDDSGLICGIAGYPSTECGAEIDPALLSNPAAEAATTSEMPATDEESSSNSNSFALGILALLTLAVGVLAFRRRNSQGK